MTPAKLRLTDIDWRAGTVTLRHTKSRREDILPLLATTGRALADYLRYERPKTSNPAVFVRRLAPLDQPISPHAVRRVIRDAFARIGLTHGRSHALRHTLACRLIEQGSSLKEVADVLRHRSLNTTLIYAKLDSRRLARCSLRGLTRRITVAGECQHERAHFDAERAGFPRRTRRLGFQARNPRLALHQLRAFMWNARRHQDR